MKRRESGMVMGRHAGPVRLTSLGAALLALGVAVPSGMVLMVGEVVWRLWR